LFGTAGDVFINLLLCEHAVLHLRSVCLYVGGSNYVGPFRDVGPDTRRKFVRSISNRLKTQRSHVFLQAIADLERVIGARLVDRGPRGVAATTYGEALLRRGTEAFDAIKLGIRDIEFLQNPGSGEVAVGADMSYIAGGFMSAILQDIAKLHPHLAVHVVETTTAASAPEFRELRDRQVDLMLGRMTSPIVSDDLQVEKLFDESIVIAASAQSPWAARRKIELAELADAPWILAPVNNLARALLEAAFRAKGLEPPLPRVTTYSMQLRMQLLTTGRYLTLFDSTAQYSAERWSLRCCP
jgi:DNA-binding transcriptional LysR family regulator